MVAAAPVESPCASDEWQDAGDVLGELSLHIAKRPEVGVEYQVVARPAGRDGRKRRSDVALVAPDGENIARGQSIWIELAGAS